MDKLEKRALLDKMVRELEDIANSQTSVVKKIGQLEAENINLNDQILESGLPEIYEHADLALSAVTTIITEFTEARDKFVADNKLDEATDAAE